MQWEDDPKCEWVTPRLSEIKTLESLFLCDSGMFVYTSSWKLHRCKLERRVILSDADAAAVWTVEKRKATFLVTEHLHNTFLEKWFDEQSRGPSFVSQTSDSDSLLSFYEDARILQVVPAWLASSGGFITFLLKVNPPLYSDAIYYPVDAAGEDLLRLYGVGVSGTRFEAQIID